MFGVSCAPEMFQKVMEQALAGCENVVNYIDDIVVFGANEIEHDEALQQVLAALKKFNILLNQDKCIFKAREIEFLGHFISSKGIRPSSNKVEALCGFREPKTSEEVRSFLGLVTYVGKFLPNLAIVTAPLRQLICNDSKFIWKDGHRDAFRPTEAND